MKKITELTAELAAPAIAEQGCTLWDVEYVKEAGEWFLRVYIDREGGVDINHCEAVSRPLSDLLDEADPIQSSYTFEVSSAGLDRVLRRPEHYQACMGQKVDVKLYRPLNGRREYTGTLRGFDGGNVAVDDQVFDKKDVAQVRLHVSF